AAFIPRAIPELQPTAASRRLTCIEDIADLLPLPGPLTTAELAARLHAGDEQVSKATAHQWVTTLVADKRALEVRIGSVQYWTAIEDAPRLRDGLGIPLPVGVPQAFAGAVEDPLGDL